MKNISMKEASKLLGFEHKEIKRTIHFDNHEYFPLLSDKVFMEMLTKTFNNCDRVLKYFNNNKLRELIAYQNTWIKLALKDPLLSEDEKKFISQMSKLKTHRSNQLWPEIANNFYKPYCYIVEFKKKNKLLKGRKDKGKQFARLFLLEALSKWYPDLKEFSFDENNADAAEEKIRPHLDACERLNHKLAP